ncbi:MAG: hypothetical protein R2806_10360 [Saprospiraceae bacterium]
MKSCLPESKQQLTVLRDSYTIESMTGYLSKFRNDLRLFHYGGHAVK